MKKKKKTMNDLKDYMTSLEYDPNRILAVVDHEREDKVVTSVDKYSNDPKNHCVIMTTEKTHDCAKNLDNFLLLSSDANIFPGALLKADDNLVKGKPTPITLARSKCQLCIENLPGETGGDKPVTPKGEKVKTFLDTRLNEYFSGHNTQPPASIYYKTSVSRAKTKVAFDLGFKADWPIGDIGALFDVENETKKTQAYSLYQQVFYSVSMENPESPEHVFDDSAQVSDLKRQLAGGGPVYVKSVYYGRMLVIKMESTKTATEKEMELAFKFLYEDTTGKARTNRKSEKIAKESTYSVAVIGGSSASVAKSLKMEDLLENFINGNEFSSENRGVPIFYKTCFLKDNAFCNIGNPCIWIETESTILNNGFFGFRNKGDFLARCNIMFNKTYNKRISGNFRKRSITYSDNTGWTACGVFKKFQHFRFRFHFHFRFRFHFHFRFHFRLVRLPPKKLEKYRKKRVNKLRYKTPRRNFVTYSEITEIF